MSIKFVKGTGSFHASVGISEERNDQLAEEISDVADQVAKEDRWVVGDIYERIMSLAKTDEEMILCALSAGGYIQHLEFMTERNKKIAEMIGAAVEKF